jgi:hypothetical protein
MLFMRRVSRFARRRRHPGIAFKFYVVGEPFDPSTCLTR